MKQLPPSADGAPPVAGDPPLEPPASPTLVPPLADVPAVDVRPPADDPPLFDAPPLEAPPFAPPPLLAVAPLAPEAPPVPDRFGLSAAGSSDEHPNRIAAMPMVESLWKTRETLVIRRSDHARGVDSTKHAASPFARLRTHPDSGGRCRTPIA